MTKDQIDAMRTVIGIHVKTVERYDERGITNVSTVFGSVSLETLRLATEGLRALVDQAAERVEGEAQPAKPEATAEAAEFAARAAVAYATGLASGAAHAAATQPEPTLEECVAAINRTCHRGCIWEVELHTRGSAWDQQLNADEIMGLGRLLIERERAAKGGAA